MKKHEEGKQDSKEKRKLAAAIVIAPRSEPTL
jgi:hypothetical protein